MKTALSVIALVAVMVLAQQLDAFDEVRDRMAQAEALQDAISQAQARARFERAAAAACKEEEAGWVEVSPGVINCTTRRGYVVQRGVKVAMQ